jgi:beta-lactamase class A
MKIEHSEVECAAPRVSRRTVLTQLVLALTAGCGTGRTSVAKSDPRITQLRRLEDAAGGRLGAYIYDTDRRTGVGWRQNERFAHCSSFKLSLAAMMLHMAERGEADVAEVLHWERRDMLSVSPVTEANLERGLSVEALARATLVTSDNTAANVLLKRFGGPASLTAFWRTVGDSVSRLDRYEPELNDTPPGTELDTTTPEAMAMTTTALVLGGALSAASSAKLRAWMAEVRTGTERIRAGFPPGWDAGDKTGTGIGKTKHTYVDIAYGGPAGRRPIIVTAYFEPATRVEPMDPVALKTLADVGRIASGGLQSRAAP